MLPIIRSFQIAGSDQLDVAGKNNVSLYLIFFGFNVRHKI